ncbi:Uncharacterised protein [Mycobacteroides abscessus subsp. massiliense]|nr:Uncharacterised protein [Mycobacteroides abscessus subsp. massiliense]
MTCAVTANDAPLSKKSVSGIVTPKRRGPLSPEARANSTTAPSKPPRASTPTTIPISTGVDMVLLEYELPLTDSRVS